jgi:hypothetical protein
VNLGSWIEITIPAARFRESAVRAAFDETIKAVGGATMTEGRGIYVRKDNGLTDYEPVIVVRWDIGAGTLTGAMYATHQLCLQLIYAGEESVLRRRYYEAALSVNPGYKSELIFA